MLSRITKMKNLGLAVCVTIVLLAFQNCSKVEFGGENSRSLVSASDEVLQSSSIGELAVSGDESLIDGGSGDDYQAGVDVICNKGSCKGNGDSSTNQENEGKNPSEEIVECELLSSNNKIVLSTYFATGSNAILSRVCMSEKSCLKVINSYASQRNCKLQGAVESEASTENQCTRIFPGSHGTCKNAKVISDEEVLSLLGIAPEV